MTNDRIKPVNDLTVANTPCCLTLQLTVSCRTNMGHKDKCGFTAPDLSAANGSTLDFVGPPTKVYQAMFGKVTTEATISRTWNVDPGENPQTFASGECTSTFSADCSDPDGSVIYDWSEDGTSFGVGTAGGTDTKDAAEDGPEAESNDICVNFAQAFASRRLPSNDLVEFVDPRWGDELLPTLEFEHIDSTGEIADCFGVDHYSAHYSRLFVGGTLETDYRYGEEVEVTEDFWLCHLLDTADLITQTQADIATGEYAHGFDCCAERSLGTTQTHYEESNVDFKFDFVAPCVGNVRIRYTLETRQEIDDDVTTTSDDFLIDGVVPGQVLHVEAPAIDPESPHNQTNTVCMTACSIEYSVI